MSNWIFPIKSVISFSENFSLFDDDSQFVAIICAHRVEK